MIPFAPLVVTRWGRHRWLFQRNDWVLIFTLLLALQGYWVVGLLYAWLGPWVLAPLCLTPCSGALIAVGPRRIRVTTFICGVPVGSAVAERPVSLIAYDDDWDGEYSVQIDALGDPLVDVPMVSARQQQNLLAELRAALADPSPGEPGCGPFRSPPSGSFETCP